MGRLLRAFQEPSVLVAHATPVGNRLYNIQATSSGKTLTNTGGRRRTTEVNFSAGMDGGGRQRTPAAVFKTVA
jgi:hypothetical protein